MLGGVQSIENLKKNVGGRPKGSKAPHTLQAEKYKAILIAEIEKNALPLAKVLIEKGLSGDVPALKEIHDRAWGRPPQSLEGPEGSKLFEGVVFLPVALTSNE